MYKLPHTIPGCLAQSAIVFLAIYSISIHVTSALIVHVSYTRHEIPDHVMPEELNFTLHAESGGNPTHIRLRRVQHIDQHIPIYTHTVDHDGKHIYKREQLPDNKNIGYYQDVSNEAAIQVTRSGSRGNEEGHLYMKGDLNIAGKKYTLTPGIRFKRDRPLFNEPGSSTQNPVGEPGEPYNLLPQTIRPVVLHDYIEAPPELIRKTIEASRYEVPESLLASLSSDPQFSSNSTSTQKPSPKRLRRQEQSAQNIYVDIVAVADYAIYSRFLADSGSRAETLQALREYYAFIFNGVDLRYKSITSVNYIIHIRLIKLIITETAAASSFTEYFRVSSRPWDEVDAQNVLSAFSEYAAFSGRDMLLPYDHVMLFTGYDLTSVQSPTTNTNATTGLAFTSTLCRLDGKSASVVEDLGGFQSVDTAAHELGHSLSSQHDGDGNTCKSSDRYIMASGSRPVTDSNRFNPWLFSSCSIVSFTNFISSQIRTPRGVACLMSNLSISAVIPDVSNRLPGQEFSPDEQCKMIYGSASRYCRGIEFAVNGNICTSMFCFDSSTVGICYEQTAAMGTTCGDGKLCLNGQCVPDSRAPSVDENCVFGDQPGPAFDGLTCPDFVNTYSGYCYQALVRGRCCTSCKNVYRTVTGCEYGDRVRGCTPNVCYYSTTSYLEKCCGTCNYGSRFTLPTTTRRISQNNRTTPQKADSLISTTQSVATIINIDPGTCEDNPITLINGLSCGEAVAANPKLCSETQVSSRCCASCDKANTGVAASTLPCTDQYNVRVNNMTCATAIRQFPFYCYTKRVVSACCLSCRQKNVGIKGCEYGDHAPQRCKSRLSASDCHNLGDDCCFTCSSSAPRDIAIILHPLLMVLCFHIFTSVLSRSTTFV